MLVKRTYGSKFLWFIAYVIVISILIGVLVFFAAILKGIQLLELNLPDYIVGIEQNYVFMVLFFVIVITAQLWIFGGYKWKQWALSKVNDDEIDDLEDKIHNKESIILKKWRDLNSKERALRVGGLFIFLLAAIYGDYYRGESNRRYQEEGIYTKAKVLSVVKKVIKNQMKVTVEYEYQVDGNTYVNSSALKTGWKIFTEEINGFPIEKGDVFKVEYLKSNPMESRLKSSEPLQGTLSKYKALALGVWDEENKEYTYRECIINEVYNAYGLKGLATIYNKEKTYFENENYNHINYGVLIEKATFKFLVENCIGDNG